MQSTRTSGWVLAVTIFIMGGCGLAYESTFSKVTAQGFNLLRELYSDDIEICSNLAAWYPQHGVTNPALHPASSPLPTWQTTWTL